MKLATGKRIGARYRQYNRWGYCWRLDHDGPDLLEVTVHGHHPYHACRTISAEVKLARTTTSLGRALAELDEPLTGERDAAWSRSLRDAAKSSGVVEAAMADAARNMTTMLEYMGYEVKG